MREMIRAVLNNPQHSGYGACTVPFPIPVQEYDTTIDLLQGLDIGDAVEKDCHVLEISGGYPVLRHLEGRNVNIEELDWLGGWTVSASMRRFNFRPWRKNCNCLTYAA